MSSKLRRIRFNSIHLLSVTCLINLWKRAFVCTLINKTRLYAAAYISLYNPHGKIGSILGNAHMRHAYKL
jgi:hypothetical protein